MANLEIFKIRNVDPEKDVEMITNIYNHYVINTAITFEIDPITNEEMRERIEKIVSKFPYLVATNSQDIVIGYSYGCTFRSRPAYDWTVEMCIYFDKETTGKGIGTRLYQELIQRLKHQGFVVAMAAITVPSNDASVRFHEKFGFKTIGTSKVCGYKMNQWHGAIFMELELNEPTYPPPKLW